KAQIKVRQPLSSVTVSHEQYELISAFEDIVREELNVKTVKTSDDIEGVVLDTMLTPALRREGAMREVVRHVQSTRKAAGLDVDDRIILKLQTDDKELKTAIEEHKDVIAEETLAKGLKTELEDGYSAQVKVNT